MIGEITIPANTAKSTPVTNTMSLGRGDFKLIRVTIPDGHKHLASLQIKDRGILVAPERGSNVEAIRGNNNTVDVTIESIHFPFELTLIGWNTDDTYSHTFYLEVR